MILSLIALSGGGATNGSPQPGQLPASAAPIAHYLSSAGPYDRNLTALRPITYYGAQPDDGKDDTEAIQKALDELTVVPYQRPFAGLFFPAGQYEISSPLRLGNKLGHPDSAVIVGAVDGNGAVASKLQWIGQSGQPMLISQAQRLTLERLRFSGTSPSGARASAGYFHEGAWPRPNGYATEMTFGDLVFENLDYGFQASPRTKPECSPVDGKCHAPQNLAEVRIYRSEFINCAKAGILVPKSNDLNWWIWKSWFVGNTIGIAQVQGGFNAYQNYFERSCEADIQIKGANFFGIRDNYSTGSKRFLEQTQGGHNQILLTMQRNTIVEPKEPPIYFVGGAAGSLILLDNHIEAAASPQDPRLRGAVMQLYKSAAPAPVTDYPVLAVGNVYYRVPQGGAVALDPSRGYKTIAFRQVEDRQTTETAPPAVVRPPQITHSFQPLGKTHLVPAGRGSANLQSAIDGACRESITLSAPVVVQLGKGQHFLDRPLTIGPSCNLVMRGAGFRETILNWISSQESPFLINLVGPLRIHLEHFEIDTYNPAAGIVANGIKISNIDRPGSRIVIDNYYQAGFYTPSSSLAVRDLRHPDVHLLNFLGNNVRSVIDVKASNQGRGTSKVVIHSGGAGNSELIFDLAGRVEVLARDFYEEKGDHFVGVVDGKHFGPYPTFMTVQGRANFTFDAGKAEAPRDCSRPVISADRRARTTFVSALLNEAGSAGDSPCPLFHSPDWELTLIGSTLWGYEKQQPRYDIVGPYGPTAVFHSGERTTRHGVGGTHRLPHLGTVSDSRLETALALTRSVGRLDDRALTASADRDDSVISINRVRHKQGKTGILIEGGFKRPPR